MDEQTTNNILKHFCQGDMDVEIPNDRSYTAGLLKELQSQLSALAWGMEQLSTGHMVSKLYYKGRLFESFNKLINLISNNSQKTDEDAPERTWSSINSWRYHQLLSALNNLKVMVFMVKENGDLIYTNRPAKEHLGCSQNLSATPQEDQNDTDILITYLSSFKSNNREFPVTTEIYDKTQLIWYGITTDWVTFADGTKEYLHVVDDISNWKKQEDTLKYTATTDPLTKTYNRRVGMQALENALQPNSINAPHCAAFIDIDDLKTINDNFGHADGDMVIQTIAETLQTSVRDNDIVCRYGGDEFLIIFNRCTKTDAERAIDRIQKKLDQINTHNRYPYQLSCSFGLIEITPEEEETLDVSDLIRQMDRLMYENKRMKKLQRQQNKQN